MSTISPASMSLPMSLKNSCSPSSPYLAGALLFIVLGALATTAGFSTFPVPLGAKIAIGCASFTLAALSTKIAKVCASFLTFTPNKTEILLKQIVELQKTQTTLLQNQAELLKLIEKSNKPTD